MNYYRLLQALHQLGLVAAGFLVLILFAGNSANLWMFCVSKLGGLIILLVLAYLYRWWDE